MKYLSLEPPLSTNYEKPLSEMQLARIPFIQCST
jgi:hypothetical protein